MQVFNLLGGLALFLYGMKLLSDGLQKLAGNNLRTILEKAASNRVSAAISGALVTGIIQSSSATTVITVGFVSAGLLTLFQAVGIIFGANIGTTSLHGLLVFLVLSLIFPYLPCPLLPSVFLPSAPKNGYGYAEAGKHYWGLAFCSLA